MQAVSRQCSLRSASRSTILRSKSMNCRSRSLNCHVSRTKRTPRRHQSISMDLMNFSRLQKRLKKSHVKNHKDQLTRSRDIQRRQTLWLPKLHHASAMLGARLPAGTHIVQASKDSITVSILTKSFSKKLTRYQPIQRVALSVTTSLIVPINLDYSLLIFQTLAHSGTTTTLHLNRASQTLPAIFSVTRRNSISRMASQRPREVRHRC